MFTVVKSFIEGQRHITINRTLGLADFTFSVKVYKSTETSGIHAGIRVGYDVMGTLKPEVLEEIKSVLPVDDYMTFDRYHREKRECLATGIVHRTCGVEDDFRGCRTEASRKVKIDRVLPAMKVRVEMMFPATKDDIVEVFNEMIGYLVSQINAKYVDSAVQNMTREWEGIHDEAGTAQKVKELGELRDRINVLRDEIKAGLNAWILKDMEATGWKVNDEVLVKPVVDILRKKYTDGEAFSSSGRLVF